jgi:nicotinamidase-related amidase
VQQNGRTALNFKTHSPALIIVDVQKAIDHPSWGTRNNPHLEQRIGDLLVAWRQRGLPVFHIRHASTEPASTYRPGQDGYEFKPEVMPKEGDEIVTKRVNCAFIGTDLERRLNSKVIRELVICGVVTNNCVDATVRVAGNLGFRVLVPEDATATFELTTRTGKSYSAEEIHSIFLTNLHGEYAEVTDTEVILAALGPQQSDDQR